MLGAYGFSALLAALFDRFASLGCAGAFVLSMGFFSVAANLGHLSVCTFVESAVAGVLLLLPPAAWGDRCTAFFENGADIAPEGSLRQSLVPRVAICRLRHGQRQRQCAGGAGEDRPH